MAAPTWMQGTTGRLLSAVLAGAQEAGATSEIVYPDKMDLQPCTGEMHCWFRQPGSCYIADDMQALYPRLRAADILLLARPGVCAAAGPHARPAQPAGAAVDATARLALRADARPLP
ncbi:MAG: flavodoxin family protein [Anaerolineae bacterium]